MAEERVERRLAAILIADVAGYSRLMSVDEERTLAALTAHRSELIEPAIASHNGRLVKTTGDGMLVEFASVLAAVRCTVAIQDGMAARNADVPETRRLDFRIGVNLGDIMVQDGDVYGDGVNVAARLESLAEPGGIAVSASVHDQVRNKVEFGFENFGPQTVKNIAEPVHVWMVRSDGPSAASVPAEAPPLAPPDRPSIAVLPFENMSGDPEQEYFSDGITEDIITDLSKIAGLLVIARNSSFVYKGRRVSLREVGREFGVRHVLEGSVRKAGGRVRITAQLIDTSNDSHVWAERYDGALDDIFALQDEVSAEVVRALEIRLTAAEVAAPASRTEHNVEAYDHLLRARQYLFRFAPEANAVARAALAEALALAPDYAEAVATLADCHLQIWILGLSRDPATLEEAARHANAAVAMDDRLAASHLALAHVKVWQRRHDAAIAEIDRAVALEPNGARVHGMRANILIWSGRPEDAITDADFAIRRDPNVAGVFLWSRGAAY